MEAYLPVTISGIFLVLAAVVGGTFAWRTRRRQEVALVPPTWAEILEKFEVQDLKIAALGRLLASAVEQHPADAPPLDLNEDDLAVVEETMPPNWRRRTRRGPAAPSQS